MFSHTFYSFFLLFLSLVPSFNFLVFVLRKKHLQLLNIWMLNVLCVMLFCNYVSRMCVFLVLVYHFDQHHHYSRCVYYERRRAVAIVSYFRYWYFQYSFAKPQINCLWSDFQYQSGLILVKKNQNIFIRV